MCGQGIFSGGSMSKWFTIDRIDEDTFILSEYRHWEETHCYLINGSERSLLIDTGLGIGNILEEVYLITGTGMSGCRVLYEYWRG